MSNMVSRFGKGLQKERRAQRQGQRTSHWVLVKGFDLSYQNRDL